METTTFVTPSIILNESLASYKYDMCIYFLESLRLCWLSYYEERVFIDSGEIQVDEQAVARQVAGVIQSTRTCDRTATAEAFFSFSSSIFHLFSLPTFLFEAKYVRYNLFTFSKS
jgi:hypothetical protein